MSLSRKLYYARIALCKARADSAANGVATPSANRKDSGVKTPVNTTTLAIAPDVTPTRVKPATTTKLLDTDILLILSWRQLR